MPDAVLNASPPLRLHRAGVLNLLPALFSSCTTAESVAAELDAGREQGWDVPSLADMPFVSIRNPAHMPEEWLAAVL